jgi:hypothetical protein
MNCTKCNIELIKGVMDINPNIPRDDRTIIKCPNCDTVIENYFMVVKDFSKNNPGKTFKIIAKLVNPTEAK